MSKAQRIGKINEDRTLRVARRGTGLYLFLPKDLCVDYGIQPDDRIKTRLKDHLRPEKEDED